MWDFAVLAVCRGERRIVSLSLLFSASLLLLPFGRLSKEARMSPSSPPFYVAALEQKEHSRHLLVYVNAILAAFE